MAKGAYISISDTAQTINNIYIGVDDVAHKVVKAYIGDANGVAQLWWDNPSIISFVIGSTTFQAESGMTWFEWVNSDYSTTSGYSFQWLDMSGGTTDAIFIDTGDGTKGPQYSYVSYTDGTYVAHADTITNGYSYIWSS